METASKNSTSSSANKRPLRGNIYLAKVTRVEPSLQAAFVDYGGNRHGFLAFSEIHPDYYQIPIADRQALLEEEEALSQHDEQHDEEDEPNADRRSRRHRRPRRPEVEARVSDGDILSESAASESFPREEGEEAAEAAEDVSLEVFGSGSSADERLPGPAPDVAREGAGSVESDEANRPAEPEQVLSSVASVEPAEHEGSHPDFTESNTPEAADALEPLQDPIHDEHSHDEEDQEVTTLDGGAEERFHPNRKDRLEDEGDPVEQVGGDAMEEVPRRPQRLRRQYKIQEVIKRRQVLLVQVVKEERGNKGAALTTYLSLAGRYSVLMPNTARGGGISRKITNAQDRSRLKGIAEELEVPEGMGVILRTAGASRTKAEVKRDFEYLLRMWETVRETTLASSAPTLVYEEGSLIKRAIRDLYSKEVDEIIVAGEAGYREARQFMRLLMPSHVNAVLLYRDTQPVFAKAGVETQLDAMFSNQVTLKSGGYIVINQTEALVAIDVNSGRSTREHNIEDTALRTNIEAADEIARQLRLRDLAGLIVVDFIDMEESRNNRAVERRIKDALKNDRARIQVGRISHFGLLEMSRQRIRTGVFEGSTVVCAHCQGAGVVRSTASIALHVLRALEDALIKSSTHDVVVRTRTAVALYILNQKRSNLRDLERRFCVAITIEADDTLTGTNYHVIERGEIATGLKSGDEHPPSPQDGFAAGVEQLPYDEEPEGENEQAPAQVKAVEVGQRGPEVSGVTEESEIVRRRRRRRRRRGGERPIGDSISPDAPQPTDDGLAAVAELGGDLQPMLGDGGSPDNSREARSDGGRNGRRSRRSRGPRGQLPQREEGVDEATVPELAASAEPVSTEGDFGLLSKSTAVLASADETERQLVVEEESTIEAPLETPHDSHPEPKASVAPIEPPLTVEETPEPQAPSVAHGPKSPAPESSEEQAPAVPESSRPRRSGWWQRARASIVGD